MSYVVRVNVTSRDGPLKVDASGKGTLGECACARAWRSDNSDVGVFVEP